MIPIACQITNLVLSDSEAVGAQLSSSFWLHFLCQLIGERVEIFVEFRE